jgi:hypothetical protein
MKKLKERETMHDEDLDGEEEEVHCTFLSGRDDRLLYHAQKFA